MAQNSQHRIEEIADIWIVAKNDSNWEIQKQNLVEFLTNQ
jgi:hypothetical protein